MDAKVYRFNDRVQMSEGVTAIATVESVLLENIPGAQSVKKAGRADDKRGTDWWVFRFNQRQLSVDAKVRELDYALRGEDDLALEIWSVKEKRKVGWTQNPAKQTDYVLWLWKETGRWCLLPFPLLCSVFMANVDAWTEEYKTREQWTPDYGGYHSECVFVPRSVVWTAMYRRFGGLVNAPVGR